MLCRSNERCGGNPITIRETLLTLIRETTRVATVKSEQELNTEHVNGNSIPDTNNNMSYSHGILRPGVTGFLLRGA